MPRWKIGDIVSVEWPEPRNGVALVGTWEGRVVADGGNRITLHFEYPPYEGESPEDIVIDVSNGLGFDEKYGEKVLMRRPARRTRKRSG
jgi:hypothetical protein